MDMLQWSPVLETGNTNLWKRNRSADDLLQWSPVLETGNTARRKTRCWLLVLQAFASAVNRPSVRGRRGRLPEGVNMALTRGRAVLRRALRTSALARRSGLLAGAAARAGRRR